MTDSHPRSAPNAPGRSLWLKPMFKCSANAYKSYLLTTYSLITRVLFDEPKTYPHVETLSLGVGRSSQKFPVAFAGVTLLDACINTRILDAFIGFASPIRSIYVTYAVEAWTLYSLNHI